MKKLKKILSLTAGFVGCMLAGVFTLQTPTLQPVEALADVSSYTKIVQIGYNNDSVSGCIYTQFFDWPAYRNVRVMHGETEDTNEALANFAKQVKVVKKDGSVSTVYDSPVTIMGRYDGVNDASGLALQWTNYEDGDTFIIQQGTTIENDINGDGVYDDTHVFAYSFKIIPSSASCTTLGCTSGTCLNGVVHSVNLGSCEQTSITNLTMVTAAGGNQNTYLRVNNALTLGGADTFAKYTDRDTPALRDWAEQMIFATPSGYDASGKPTGYTYRNYYEHGLEVEPNFFAIQTQSQSYDASGNLVEGRVNINFTSFRNEYDVLIIPQGTTLRWDTNGDDVLEYYWVASQTYRFMRWTEGATSTATYNCANLKTATGISCYSHTAGATTTGYCTGYIHQLRATDETVVTLVSEKEITTENTASLTINNKKLNLLGEYAFDASTWTYNGNPFTDVCDVNIENGYINFAKKSGVFAHKDCIIIPVGSVITNTVTGDTYTFTASRQLYYLNGTWYSFDKYYEIGKITRVLNNTPNNLYVWFADVNGNMVYHGYYKEGENPGTWYTPDKNGEAFIEQLICSQTLDSVQICGQENGLYFRNNAGLFASGTTLKIPRGTVWYANAQNNSVIQAQTIWYFPYDFNLEVGEFDNAQNSAFTNTITLPEAPEMTGNNVFVGYKLINKTTGAVESKLYGAGEAFDPTTYTYEAVTLEMYMEKGASVRLSEVDGINGIRYTVNVNKAQLQSIKDTFGATINLGLRIRVVNSEGKISKTESSFTAITDALGATQTGNCRESGDHLVYTVVYVMHDEYIDLEVDKSYQWLGDGFVEVVNSESTVKAYAVQNDNARSYRWLLHYYLNESWTEEATETNVYAIKHKLSDGISTQVRYYSFYYPTYQVLLSEAVRAKITVMDNK